jgi:Cu-processing system permease protein
VNALVVARLVRRELLGRPLHLFLLLGSAGLLTLARAMASFGFRQENALARLSSLEAISVYAFVTVVLLGAGAVGRDVEGRLLVSILSRPIGRGAYLLGRFLGLIQTVAVGCAALAALSLLLLDRADDAGAPAVPVLLASIGLTVLQAAALAAAVLALSLFAPPSLALVLSFLIAGAGLLAEPVRRALSPESGVAVLTLARAFALALPPLSHPGEASSVAFGGSLPGSTALLVAARAAVYSGLALLLASWRLSRKDLT